MNDPRPAPEPPHSYESVAGLYDGIARCWSCGRIDRAKQWQSEALPAGGDWLFVGVGTGLEAALAARRGARVTALDVSPAMLSATRRRLEAAGLSATLSEADLFDHHEPGGYDVVVANFVLNVMGPATMRRALGHLAGLVRPSGWLTIADFAAARGSWLARATAQLNWTPVLQAGRLLSLASAHPLYDYAGPLHGVGLHVEQRQRFSLWPRGPALYEVLLARPAVALAPSVNGARGTGPPRRAAPRPIARGFSATRRS